MNAEPQRFAFVTGVRPEKREQYLELHRAVWPAVEAKMTECNIRNYSIFIVGDMLFAYYEYVGDDHEADQRRIAADPVSQEWWTHTDPCNVPLGGEGGGDSGGDRDSRSPWKPLAEIWHMA